MNKRKETPSVKKSISPRKKEVITEDPKSKMDEDVEMRVKRIQKAFDEDDHQLKDNRGKSRSAKVEGNSREDIKPKQKSNQRHALKDYKAKTIVEDVKPKEEKDGMRLNRFIAHSGVCSRRDADELIKSGRIKVNGKVIDAPGFNWLPGMKVLFDGKQIQPEEKKIYVLLNKPKNTITTTEDENGRLTVMDIVKNGLDRKGLGHIRVYPIGRLDRNTTGVLLLTNDGDLANKLAHPSNEVEKIYQVRTDKNIIPEDMKKLATGIELEDGVIHADQIAFVHESTKDEVGVVVHSGKNRIVRRMFEHLGYEVLKLDRVSFAGLTKKDMPRGRWRLLTDSEIRNLKFLNKYENKPSKKKK